MGEKRMSVVEDRIVRAIYTVMQNGAGIDRLSLELGVSKSSARRYAKMLIDARIVVRKESKGKLKLVMSPLDCYAIFKVERDFVGITVCSFAKKYINSVIVPYNEALIPEHTVTNCVYTLKRMCKEMGFLRVFCGTIVCEGQCVEKELCNGFFANVMLDETECERIALKREKERTCVFTEYFCNSVRKARLSDRIIDSWRSMDASERGMIDALLGYVAKGIHKGKPI